MYKIVIGVLLCIITTLSHASEELAKASTCFACHTLDKKLVGPAFKEIALRYNQVPNVEDMLFNKVRVGSSGVWGAIPMPAMGVSVKEADIKKLVTWILNLK